MQGVGIALCFQTDCLEGRIKCAVLARARRQGAGAVDLHGRTVRKDRHRDAASRSPENGGRE